MAYYRLYFLDRSSGHIDHFREFETLTDADAVGQAEIWREASAMELWCGRRKVMRNPSLPHPKRSPATPSGASERCPDPQPRAGKAYQVAKVIPIPTTAAVRATGSHT